MTQDEITPLVTYALTSAVGVIGILIAVVWNMVRNEAQGTSAALDKKASSEALRDVKQHFHDTMQRQHVDYQERLRVLTEKQDREIDWLKQEMDKISGTLVEMRKESVAANNAIMQRLDLVLSHERRAQTT